VATGRFRGDLSCVRVDDRAAAEDMTRYLLGLGHRRIGFIKGHPNQSVSNQRLHGFLDVLRDAGIDQDPALIQQGYFDYRSGMAAAEKLLHGAERPTAIFAANDDMAAATVAVATRLGIQVPRDLSVTGFDDTPISSIVYPALTTIRQPIAAMGRSAIDLLLSEVKRLRDHEKRAPAEELLPHALIKRESTGPVV
jgi:LacI family transcriptional regulator